MKASRTVVGVDTAKWEFQLHWVELETGEMVDVRPSRARLLEHFANRAACLVGMEPCGGAQHWARRLREPRHEVHLLPARMVRPFVSGNKNDAHDARAIWTAVQQLEVKTVAVKTEEQRTTSHIAPPPPPPLLTHSPRTRNHKTGDGVLLNDLRRVRNKFRCRPFDLEQFAHPLSQFIIHLKQMHVVDNQITQNTSREMVVPCLLLEFRNFRKRHTWEMIQLH